MTAVGIRAGIKYGFLLLGYFVGVFIVGGIVLGIGVAIASGDGTAVTVVGGVLAIVGGVIVYAGLFGVLYKIIADGVETGIVSAGGLERGGTGSADTNRGTTTVPDGGSGDRNDRR